MKKLILLLILFSTLNVFSQSQKNELKAEGQINFERPTVYLEYVCQNKEKIRLKMFNNTIWTLAVGSDELYYKTKKTVKLSSGLEYFTMPNDKEVSIRYYIEKFALPSEKVKVPAVSYSDSFNINWIASNDSALFSVPLKYLKENLQVFVRFNYEWEFSKNGAITSGPEHRVSFRGIDIPSKIITCEN